MGGSGDEPTPSPRAAAVARLGPALELLARSGRRSACAAAAFSFSGGRQGLMGLSSSEHARSPGVAGAEQNHLVPLAARRVSSLKRAGTASGAMTSRTGCRGRGLCLNGKIRVCGVSEPCGNFTGA
jgi:hypothetical protein